MPWEAVVGEQRAALIPPEALAVIEETVTLMPHERYFLRRYAVEGADMITIAAELEWTLPQAQRNWLELVEAVERHQPRSGSAVGYWNIVLRLLRGHRGHAPKTPACGQSKYTKKLHEMAVRGRVVVAEDLAWGEWRLGGWRTDLDVDPSLSQPNYEARKRQQ